MILYSATLILNTPLISVYPKVDGNERILS